MKNIIFAGGYHTGRKLLINSILQDECFIVYESTTKVQSVTVNGINYIETPPLFSDKEVEQNTKSLVHYVLHALFSEDQGTVFLVFVVLVEGDSIRECDVNAVKVAVRALDDVGLPTAHKFAVLVNKVDKRFYKKKRLQTEFAMRVSHMFSIIGIDVSPDNIGFVSDERIRSRTGTDASFLKCESWAGFIERAPVMSVNSQSFSSSESPSRIQSVAMDSADPVGQTRRGNNITSRSTPHPMSNRSSMNGDNRPSDEPTLQALEDEHTSAPTALPNDFPPNSIESISHHQSPIDGIAFRANHHASSSSECSMTSSPFPDRPPAKSSQDYTMKDDSMPTGPSCPTLSSTNGSSSPFQVDQHRGYKTNVDTVCTFPYESSRYTTNKAPDEKIPSTTELTRNERLPFNTPPPSSSLHLPKRPLLLFEACSPNNTDHRISATPEINASHPNSGLPYQCSPYKLVTNESELPLEARNVISDIEMHDRRLSDLHDLQRKYSEDRRRYLECLRNTESAMKKVKFDTHVCQSHITVLKSNLQAILDEARQQQWRDANKTKHQGILEQLECAICLEDIERRDAFSLPCGHVFHNVCVNKWIAKKRSCPICKIRVN